MVFVCWDGGCCGVVCWKLRVWRVAFGAFPLRKEGGIGVIVDVLYSISLSL